MITIKKRVAMLRRKEGYIPPPIQPPVETFFLVTQNNFYVTDANNRRFTVKNGN